MTLRHRLLIQIAVHAPHRFGPVFVGEVMSNGIADASAKGRSTILSPAPEMDHVLLCKAGICDVCECAYTLVQAEQENRRAHPPIGIEDQRIHRSRLRRGPIRRNVRYGSLVATA